MKAKARLKPNSPHSRYDGPVAGQREIECCGLNGVQCMLMLWMMCPALPQCGVKGHEASKAVHEGHILQTKLALLLFFFLFLFPGFCMRKFFFFFFFKPTQNNRVTALQLYFT